ncbi:Transcription termination factor 2 [Colletotrichum higginsianum]|uniref:Transcription termination factor 2 n=2 Tax=Colletotrichum higginsianum TaxID=80884 RepID=A0A4T0WMJ2_9PEZI|nr:Transcription termination factor 2 [Colletotrichum higginsianum]
MDAEVSQSEMDDEEMQESMDDELMMDAEDDSEYEVQEQALGTKLAGKKRKRVTFADDNTTKDSVTRQARTAQEYTVFLRQKADKNLKRDFIRQIQVKRKAGITDIVLQPPKAKRRRQRRTTNNHLSDLEELGSSALPELGAIPNPNQAKVSRQVRMRQIAMATTEGDSNRHLGSQREDARLGMKIWGRGVVTCVGVSDYLLRGMKTPVRGWQLQASARMVIRENATERPNGGILGDQMGMGKTLTSLLLIVGCPPLSEDIQAGCGGTLVVVPGPNVLKEWSEAIIKHTSAIQPGDVLVFKKGSNTLEISQIAQYKIVITTYQELLKYPSGKKMEALITKHGKGTQALRAAVKQIAGPLFDIEWYRVVFDELHTIKNSETQTFLSCYQLNTKRVWGLSGTPLINQCKEIYPYVKLVRVEGIDTKKDFIRIYKKGPDAARKLDALINQITIRRNHEDEFLGKQMLEGIPNFDAEIRWVNLSEEERLIYDAITDHFKSKASIVAMANKRRAISHPYLLEKSFLEKIDCAAIRALIDSLKEVEGRRWVYHQIGRRTSREDPDTASATQQPDSDDEEAPALTPQEISYVPMDPFGKSSFGGMFSMSRLLEGTIAEKEIVDIKCGICKQRQQADPWRIAELKIERVPTLKAMAQGHVSEATEESGDEDSDNEESDNEDPHDETLVTNNATSRQIIAAKSRKVQENRERKRVMRRKHGADYINNLPVLDDNDAMFVNISVNWNGGVPCPGTKLTVAKEIILQWQMEAPEDKIIIFIEFIKTAVLLGVVLNLEGIPFVYLNGKLTTKEKIDAVDAFKNDPKVKILIASMRVGGQALNLTCANRIIQIDSWWNESAGDQANGRVNRMGQLKPSHAVAIKARDTIDEYITDLQGRKTQEIEYVMQDDGRVTEMLSDFERMALTAPIAWDETKQRLIEEIEEENGPESVLGVH